MFYAGNFRLNDSNQKQDCLVFCVNPNTGLADNLLQEQIIIFPNPATDNLNVVVTSKMLVGIHLYNINGKEMYSCSGCSGEYDNHSLEIDVSQFSPGVYVLVAETSGGQILEKITLQ